MSNRLNSLISYYYGKEMNDADSLEDSLTAMKALDKSVIDEVIKEHVETVTEQKRKRWEEIEKVERERALRENIRSFNRMLLECVIIALLIGLIGSHLYGIFEAWLFAPNADFRTGISVCVLLLLIATCVAILVMVFTKSLPDWVKDAMRRRNDE